MLPDYIPDDDIRVARMLGVMPGHWRKLKAVICNGRLYTIRDGFFSAKKARKIVRGGDRGEGKKTAGREHALGR